MGNKLVFVSGAPFWFTPEGRFEATEQSNGLFVERVLLRTERGLREIGSRQSRSIERRNAMERSRNDRLRTE